MKILGLDISTTTIGVAVAEYTTSTDTGHVILLDYVKPEGVSPLHKAINANEKLRVMLHGIYIDRIVIERPVIMFKGGSSGQTVALLNWFSGAMAVQLWKTFEKDPIYVAPSTARKAVFGVGRFPKGTDTKKEVFRRVSQELPGFQWPATPRLTFKPECFDMADAFVISMSVIRDPQLFSIMEAAWRQE